MAITIVNRRIDPYTQKNDIKAIFGDTMIIALTLPEPYVAGDEYTLGLDYERIVFPTVRPVCALSQDYFITGSNITFTVELNTERFAKWVSSIKKPMPIWMQIVRVRGDVSETLLLDDILAIPSVIDGENTVFPGDPLDSRLAEKLDKPEAEGSAGQVLKLGEDGQPIWANGGGGPGGDIYWEDIQGKPSFATVAETGSYNDLSNKPTIPTVGAGVITIIQGGVSKGSFSVNQSSAASIELDAGGGSVNWADIQGKPSFSTVAETGSYNDLTDKPTIPTDYIPTSAIGSAGGVAALNSSGLVPDGQITLERPIITIPTATTAYTFADGAVYQHTPAAAPTYSLPAVTDFNRTHTVIISVQFSAVQTCIFTYGGSTVAPLDALTIAAGDVVEYLCRFDPLQVKWVIACGKMNQ